LQIKLFDTVLLFNYLIFKVYVTRFDSRKELCVVHSVLKALDNPKVLHFVRHGKKFLEVAMAMHNIRVVCVKGGRFEEGTWLCDGAAGIRVELLGSDHLDVAVSANDWIAFGLISSCCIPDLLIIRFN
jgi:hypothetical protein